MKYIRPCENCFREVRFPLDKGILLVKCPYCGHSYRVDPDDPSLYRKGRFDLSIEKSPNISKPFFGFEQKPNFNLQKFIVFTLFLLLFLNLYKAFSGFEDDNFYQEKIHLEEDIPEDTGPPKKTPNSESLYHI